MINDVDHLFSSARMDLANIWRPQALKVSSHFTIYTASLKHSTLLLFLARPNY